MPMRLIDYKVLTFYSLKRKALSFLGRPFWIQLWFIPTWLMLGVAKALIFTVPFKKLAPRLGISMGIASRVPLLDTRSEMRALQIGRVVRLAAGYTPWDSNCFHKRLWPACC